MMPEGTPFLQIPNGLIPKTTSGRTAAMLSRTWRTNRETLPRRQFPRLAPSPYAAYEAASWLVIWFGGYG